MTSETEGGLCQFHKLRTVDGYVCHYSIILINIITRPREPKGGALRKAGETLRGMGPSSLMIDVIVLEQQSPYPRAA